MHNAKIKSVVLHNTGVSFYIAVNDTPIANTTTTDIEIAMISYLRKRRVYVATNHMSINDLDEVKLALKCRPGIDEKSITLKEDIITAL